MLRADGLFHYYGGQAGVLDLTFVLRPGEVLGLLGPNGSGKSTTVRLVAGLMTPTRGSIRFNNRDVHDDLDAFKARLGYVPEDGQLYPFMTPDEYLQMCGLLQRMPEPLVQRRVRGFLELLGLDAHRSSRLSTLSKGMRQKVLLAAALIHDPELVVVDEPASGLDVPSMLMLRALIDGLRRDGRLVFYSSHELDIVQKVSSRLMILSNGRVAAEGTYAELQELTGKASLEEVFTQLAVKDDAARTATDMIDVMQRG